MIKMIFFDIDGTLLNSKGKISASTQKAISMVQQQGIICGISTGRTPGSVHAVLKEFPLDVFIVCNGQLVYTTDELIYAKAFDENVLDDIVTYAEAFSRQVLFCGRNHSAGSKTMQFGQSRLLTQIIRFVPKKIPVSFLQTTMQKYRPKRFQAERYSGLQILNEPVYQCVMLAGTDEDHSLKKALPHCDLKRSNPYSVDIVPKDSSKLTGIKFLAAHFDIAMDEVMVFGDHLNDIEMITGAGLGVAMGNATAKTKQAADFITQTNDQEGIYTALKYFNVI